MLVSVVIPCFNVEHFITECIESVVSQTHQELEIICVDNNSNDNTWDTLLELKDTYPNIIIEKEIKKGANAARNKGLNIAKGEWIQFLDADDLIEPKKIEHQISLIQSASNLVSFVAGAYVKKFLDGNKIILNVSTINEFVSPFINKCGITSSNLWNRNSLIQIGGWNESLNSSQETDLMLRLILKNHKYVLDLEPKTIVRQRESGQISQSNPIKKWEQYIDIRLKYLENFRAYNLNDYNNNLQYLLDFLMVSILILAKYDLKIALKYYNMYIKNDWISSNKFGFSKVKVFIIKFLGLKTFIILNSLLKNIYVK